MTTGESAEEIPPEDALTKLRFRLDGLRERVKRIWAAMHGQDERGPQDYAPWDDERRILINIIRKQTERGGGGNYVENGGGNGWNKWMLTLFGGLTLAGIIGGVAMFGKLSAIEANQTNQQRQLDSLSSAVATLRRAP